MIALLKTRLEISERLVQRLGERDRLKQRHDLTDPPSVRLQVITGHHLAKRIARVHDSDLELTERDIGVQQSLLHARPEVLRDPHAPQARPSDGRMVSQSAVHEACVVLLRAILQVHAEDGGNCLTYGAVLNLDTATTRLTAAIAGLKSELGRRAVAS